MAATPLGSLLSQSWSRFRAGLVPILIGALVFGSLLAIVQAGLINEAQRGADTFMDGLGLDTARMEELGRRIEAGDEDAVREMMAGLEGFNQNLEGMTEDQQAAFFRENILGSFAGMLPALGLGALLSFLLGALSLTYFSILALRGTADPVMIGRQTPGLFLPMLGLMIWITLRSFIWIPIIGIIPAVILGPRFIASLVYLVRDGKGILESARLSYGATRGYWAKIMGNGIVLMIILTAVAFVLNILLGVIGAFTADVVALWGISVVQQLISAFAILFGVRLALTVMENPRTAASAAA